MKQEAQATIVAIINQKGGVAKTTTASAIGSGLAIKGKRVLFVDTDAQGNLSQTMRANESGPTTLQVLAKQAKAAQAIQHTPGGDIIPAGAGLSGADAIISQTGKEYRLREALEGIRREYDYIIIDTPPALGIITVNALTAADKIIIPAQADIYSLQGIRSLYDTIDTVRKYCNPGLQVDGILLTRYNGRAIISRELADAAEQTARHFATRLYKKPIRECIAIKEAQAERCSIFAYSPKCNAAIDYDAAINELLEE